MKIGTISKTNTKGQIVIPVEFRKKLGITPNDLLHLFVRGGGLFIQPIKEVITSIESEDNYLKVLERTRGAWGILQNKDKQTERKRRARELAASKKRKDLW